jgi:hypothetical protein
MYWEEKVEHLRVQSRHCLERLKKIMKNLSHYFRFSGKGENQAEYITV